MYSNLKRIAMENNYFNEQLEEKTSKLQIKSISPEIMKQTLKSTPQSLWPIEIYIDVACTQSEH